MTNSSGRAVTSLGGRGLGTYMSPRSLPSPLPALRSRASTRGAELSSLLCSKGRAGLCEGRRRPTASAGCGDTFYFTALSFYFIKSQHVFPTERVHHLSRAINHFKLILSPISHFSAN